MLRKMAIVILRIAMFLGTQSADAQNDGNIALVMKALSNPFFLKMQTGAKEYAEKQKLLLETVL